MRVAAVGWVLPGQSGASETMPVWRAADLLAQRASIAEFSVKGLLSAVKGYLDPAGAYTLGAAALCRHHAPAPSGERCAVVSVSQYGASGSAYTFYQQLLDKGPRLASPLIFPHGYANTAGNLVAIEFGLAGPHLVLNTAPDLHEAWAWARATLRWGQADEVLLLAAEAALPAALPDGWTVLPGALCWRLTWDDTAEHDAVPPGKHAPGNRHGVVWAALNRE